MSRLKSLITGNVVKTPPFDDPSGAVDVENAASQDEDAEAIAKTESADLKTLLARGLVIRKARDRMIVELGSLGRPELTLPSSQLSVAMRISGKDKGAGLVERLELDVPRRAVVTFPGNDVVSEVTFDALEAKRGAPLSFKVKSTIGVGSSRYVMSLHAKTFVRDVVSDDATARLMPQDTPHSAAASEARDR